MKGDERKSSKQEPNENNITQIAVKWLETSNLPNPHGLIIFHLSIQLPFCLLTGWSKLLAGSLGSSVPVVNLFVFLSFCLFTSCQFVWLFLILSDYRVMQDFARKCHFVWLFLILFAYRVKQALARKQHVKLFCLFLILFAYRVKQAFARLLVLRLPYGIGRSSRSKRWTSLEGTRGLPSIESGLTLPKTKKQPRFRVDLHYLQQRNNFHFEWTAINLKQRANLDFEWNVFTLKQRNNFDFV